MEYGSEKVKPYGGTASKTEQVEEMFDSIAPAYDRMNRLMSLGLDRSWRRRTISRLARRGASRVLDIACGTGDMTYEIWKRLSPQKLTGADLSEGMLEVARRKWDFIDFCKCDCCKGLPFGDGSFDAVTIAFGVRNFESLEAGLREIRRVLSPSGTLAVLELGTPVGFPFRQLYDLYAYRIIPLVGGALSHDRKAYDYLPRSIAAFPQREAFTDLMQKCGFTDCSFTPMTFGTCILYLGSVPTTCR